jgi:hypothetical protein
MRSVSPIPLAASAADPPRSWRPRDLGDLTTPQLLEAVVTSAYEGHPWDELARRFVARALPDLERSIVAGTIYRRCRRAGFGLPRRAELQRRPLSGDIAAEAVEDCLERFKAQVLPKGEWDPGQGVSLEDFFTSCCLPDVANSRRRHLRQAPPHVVELDALDEPGQADVLALAANPPADPAAVAELRDFVTSTLAPLL